MPTQVKTITYIIAECDLCGSRLTDRDDGSELFRDMDHLRRQADLAGWSVGPTDPAAVVCDIPSRRHSIAILEIRTSRGPVFTLQETADYLNVSPGFVIDLIGTGIITGWCTGGEWDATVESVRDYREWDGVSRRKAADDLTALGQELEPGP